MLLAACAGSWLAGEVHWVQRAHLQLFWKVGAFSLAKNKLLSIE